MDLFLFLVFGFFSVSNTQPMQMDHSAHGMSPGGSGTARRSCRPGWDRNADPETGANTCLWYSDMEATFTDAWIWCTILNSHVTSVFSQSMQTGISFNSKMRHKGKYWIGISDIESRGQYKQVYNQERVTYFRPYGTWIPGKPSTSLQNRCVYLDNDKQQLSDEPCTAKHRFICQDHY